MLETLPAATSARDAVEARRRYTYAEARAQLPETNQPCELWDGELTMSPAPSFYHQKVALRFYKALDAWVSARGLGEVIAAPVDMVLSERRVMQPDVAYISRARLGIIEHAIMGPADLVAEVVSLEGRHRDRIEKKDLYQQHGVQEYWIIDPEAQTVEVLFQEQNTFQLVQRSRPGDRAASRMLSGFELDVRELLQPTGH